MKRAFVLLMACLVPVLALAHHSLGMFDMTREITVDGTVKEFKWINPHSWLDLMVTDESGKEVVWSIEFQSPILLTKQGWKSTTLKAGDKLHITFSPQRDGSTIGSFKKMTLADGREIVFGGGRPVAPQDQ